MDVIQLLTSSPVFSVVLVLVASVLLNEIKRGAISSISTKGIIFNNKDTEKLESMLKDVSTIKQELVIVKQSNTIITQELNTVKQYNKRLELALLRLQILSPETNLETKLSLYDEYKFLGGNSYIDLYISKYKGDD